MFAKMNALVDRDIIEALYKASQAGVKIKLLIRGICCLRPGLPGISENIEVRSIVDQFLEHSRIYAFANDGSPEVFLGSADWMPRNLIRRIEVVFPVLEPRLRNRILDEIIALFHRDNVQSPRDAAGRHLRARRSRIWKGSRTIPSPLHFTGGNFQQAHIPILHDPTANGGRAEVARLFLPCAFPGLGL